MSNPEVEKVSLSDRNREENIDIGPIFKRLLEYFGGHKLTVFLSILFTILGALITVIIPVVLGLITTSLGEVMMERSKGAVNTPIDFPYIWKIASILLGLYISYSVLQYFASFLMGRVTQNVVYQLRKDVNEKLHKLSISFYDYNKTGDILSRVSNDVDTISNSLQDSLNTTVSSIITVIGVLVTMIFISPVLTAVMLFVVPVSGFFARKLSKSARGYYKKQQNALGDQSAMIEEAYGGHEVVKSYSLEEENIKEFDEINERLRDSSQKANFISGFIRPLIGFLGNVGYIIIVMISGFFVFSGRIAIGQMQAVMQYSRSFFEPINQLADIMNLIQSTFTAADRIFQVLDMEDEKDEGQKLLEEPVSGRVTFEHVDFGYFKDEILIKDLSFEAKPHEMVAIVGPTGAGKSTIINLLLRFYDIFSGDIKIDGQSIYNLSKEELRNHFAMVLQDSWTFKGTVHENIAYGMDASREEVVEAAKAAQADFFIRTFPQGYDTMINEEGSNISEGQKQLISIARAFMKNTDILIFDEATSSVDTRTEILIQKAMDELMAGKTSFVIAHRLSTIVNADLILVMKDGDIIEQGTHKELLEEKGFYYELYDSQFKKGIEEEEMEENYGL